jgi:hypothetical protein
VRAENAVRAGEAVRAENAVRAEKAVRDEKAARDERRLDSPSERSLRVVSSGPIEAASPRGPLAPPEGSRGTGFGTYGDSPRESELSRGDQRSARSQMFRNRAVESSLPNAAVVSQQFGAESGARPYDAPPALRAVSGDGPIRNDPPMRGDAPVRGSGAMRAVASSSGGFADGGAPTADIGSSAAAELSHELVRNPRGRGRDESMAELRHPRRDASDRIDAAESRRSDRSWDGRYDWDGRDGIDQHRGRDDRAAGVEDSSALGSLDSSALFGTLSGLRAVPERAPR